MPDNEIGSLGDGPDTDQANNLSADEGGASSLDAGVGMDREPLLAAVAAEREKYLRLAAEFDNYRKRAIRERQEAGAKAQADLVQGLVEVLDDIMRFAHLDPSTVDSGMVVQGVAMVERKVMKTLSGHGLEIIDPIGRPFDPAFHEAVGTEPAASIDEDHLVARVYQPGFLFRGQLIRPARVVVKQWLG